MGIHVPLVAYSTKIALVGVDSVLFYVLWIHQVVIFICYYFHPLLYKQRDSFFIIQLCSIEC